MAATTRGIGLAVAGVDGLDGTNGADGAHGIAGPEGQPGVPGAPGELRAAATDVTALFAAEIERGIRVVTGASGE